MTKGGEGSGLQRSGASWRVIYLAVALGLVGGIGISALEYVLGGTGDGYRLIGAWANIGEGGNSHSYADQTECQSQRHSEPASFYVKMCQQWFWAESIGSEKHKRYRRQNGHP